MVGSNLLIMIHKSLSYITGSTKLFGNVAVLAVGDLYQLQPVRQKHVFLPPSDATAQFAAIWQNSFKYFELSTVMRQRDMEFSGLLNRMRVEELREEDIFVLRSRDIIKHPDYPRDAMHVYTTNADVDDHNEEKLEQLETTKHTLPALDNCRDKHTGKLHVLPSTKHTETGGLRQNLRIAKGAKVMLTSNIDVSDGLVNGAVSVVVGFILSDEHVHKVMVKFSDERAGHRTQQHSPYSTDYPSAVPISRVEALFCVGKRKSVKMSRKQFPLTLAWACKIHKVQGMTMPSTVVSMTGRFMPGHAYVACSRVTSFYGLYIVHFNPKKIKANDQVREETSRLQNCTLEIPPCDPISYQSPEILSVASLNIRSYAKYQNELMLPNISVDVM
ncbi:ATP-dependent DNA helicase PIF1 [Holothuria leucospilota]|uniref:ATP-dependent DNA helicase PIF1 n=1 Tax=Holothuria leucospilota TaxID=206669 RepID=A0A9Q1CQ67_HOLLE|nr:ATP-dependent DNA helicase PIF1 [Holothuria leucospilota]